MKIFFNNRQKKYIISFLILAGFLFAGQIVFAQPDTGLEYAENIGLSGQDIRITIAKIIRIFIGFLGIIAVCIIMYGGWLWMTSQGNEEKIGQAKKVLKNAAIGLLIILSAFGIVSFIISKLIEATTGGTGGSGAGGGIGSGLASAGNRVVESHYPVRFQKNVPRNSKIVITFREAMLPSSVIDDSNKNGIFGDWADANGNGNVDDGEYDKINKGNIIIYRTVDKISGAHVEKVMALKTADNKIFVFKPMDYLGSPSENIDYTVALSTQLKKSSGDLAFAGIMREIGYDWSFEVGTLLDFTPPKVKDVYPYPDETEPRNVVIQVNYNESVDPTTVTGNAQSGQGEFDPPMSRIINKTAGETMIPGNFYISNMYKTVEFLTEDACGKNSCGNTVYCLPGNSAISALLKAATLLPGMGTATSATARFPYNGVVDMCDNSLDGNGDGKAEGPQSQTGKEPYNANKPDALVQGDDYIWSFNTNDKIEISAPVIESIRPNIRDMGISLISIPQAAFSRVLMGASLNKNNIPFYSSPAASEVFYWLTFNNATSTKKSALHIEHDQFLETSSYTPELDSGIRDIYQNCYMPAGGPSCTPDTNNPYCCNANRQNTNCKPIQ